jgi:hypothetical protein
VLTRGTILFVRTVSGGSRSLTVRPYADLTPRIGPYRFGTDLISCIKTQSDGGGERRGGLTGGQLGFRRERSALNGANDVGLPGGDGVDDETRRMTASKKVAVAWSIGWRRFVEGWRELADAAGSCVRFRRERLQFCCGVLQRDKRGGIYRRGGLGERLGFRARLEMDSGDNTHA